MAAEQSAGRTGQGVPRASHLLAVGQRTLAGKGSAYAEHLDVAGRHSTCYSDVSRECMTHTRISRSDAVNICHAGNEYVVSMHGFEIFRTDSKAELLTFVNNVVKGW